MKPNLLFTDNERNILLLHERYPAPAKGTGTNITPGLLDGCTNSGLLESIKLLFASLVSVESPVLAIFQKSKRS